MTTTTFDSPIGIFAITGDDAHGIFSVKKVAQHEASVVTAAEVLECQKQLLEYFAGQRKIFDVRLNFVDAPAFHQLVWKQLLQVPYGSTTTYSEIAQHLNQPKASQAVGLANKMNRFAIVVPCHRVIGKNGHLTGYFYGLETKQKLLALENPVRYVIQEQLDFQQ